MVAILSASQFRRTCSGARFHNWPWLPGVGATLCGGPLLAKLPF